MTFPFQTSVFYPGSGIDWRVIRDCIHTNMVSSALNANSFIYADYGVSQQQIRECLAVAGGLRGLLNNDDLATLTGEPWGEESPYTMRDHRTLPDYKLEYLEDLPLQAVLPINPVSHLPQVALHFPDGGPRVPPYALRGNIRIREKHYYAKTWPEHLKILFLGTEATATYDELFCQQGQQAPLVVALHAGMHIGFGQGSPLEALANEIGRLPEYLLLLDNGVQPWDGYEPWEGRFWRRQP